MTAAVSIAASDGEAGLPEKDGTASIAASSQARSVMRMTETILDELCVGVEKDLLGADDENYKDLIRQYRILKEQEDDRTVTSLGTLSLEDHHPDKDLEDIQKELLGDNKGAITSIIQTVLFRKKEKDHSTTTKTSHIRAVVEVEPEPSPDPAANLDDSVEVESTEEGSAASIILEKKAVFSEVAKLTPGSKQPQDQASLASTEVATDSSSSEEEDAEEELQSQDDGSVETLENGKVTIKELSENGDIELEHFPTIKESSNRNIELQHFPSFIDTSRNIIDYTTRLHSDISAPRMERQSSKIGASAATSKMIADHLKQRRAIYMWSMSVLRQKMEEHGLQEGDSSEITALLDPNSPKPQLIHEYDRTILLALGYSMNGGRASDQTALAMKDTAKPRRFSMSKYMASVGIKSQQAKIVMRDSYRAAIVPLQLRKRVVKVPSDAMIDWQQIRVVLSEKAALTTKKSIHFVRNEVILDTMYIAKQLAKRAIKLHETLSLLKKAHLKLRPPSHRNFVKEAPQFGYPFEDDSVQASVPSSLQASSIPGSVYDEDDDDDESVQSSGASSLPESANGKSVQSFTPRSIPISVYDESIHSSMEGSMQASEQSIEVPNESVEVVEPLLMDSTTKTLKQRRLSKTLKKQISEWKKPVSRKLRKRLVQQAASCKRAHVTDLKREMVMYHMEQEEEDDEVTFGFEVAAM